MYTIAVCGGSGSGKSYICQRIMEAVGVAHICHLSQDHYYVPRHLQPYDSNGAQNFDTLQSIDLVAFSKDVKLLQQGHEIHKLEYVYNNPEAKPTQLTFRPAPILLLEGLLLMHTAAMRDLSTFKIFVEASEANKLDRRIRRDATERGYDSEDVRYRFQHHVAPMYSQYIAPYKTDADLVIINNGEEIQPQLEVILKQIYAVVKI